MNNIYPKCTICGQTPVGGLYDGFRLAHRLICSCCEKQMVETSIGTAAYQHHIESIKNILYR